MPHHNKPSPPRPIEKDDWVCVLSTGEQGIVENVMDHGERLWVRFPSKTDWPWPRWAHIPKEKVKRIRPPKGKTPEITTEEALL